MERGRWDAVTVIEARSEEARVRSKIGPTGGVPRSGGRAGGLGRLLIGAGVVVGLFAAYQLWGTGIQEARSQAALRDEFEHKVEESRRRLAGVEEPTREPVVDADDSVAQPAVDPVVLSLLVPRDGDAVARIEIPSLGVDKVVVRGTQVDDLRRGPGLYRSTTMPGSAGNAAIAGHRTTFGAPFNRIDELVPGDEIVVTTIQGRFEYLVAEARAAFAARADDVDGFGDGHALVRPGDNWVLDDFGDNRLTLTACNPEFSARQRIIVAATLVNSPVGPSGGPADTVDGPTTDLPPAGAAASVDVDPAPSPTGDRARAVRSGVAGSTGDLDEGLGGDRGAIPAAIAWLVAATGLWLVAARFSHRRVAWRAKLLPYGIVLGPVLVALWLGFEATDRALPAY